MSWVDTAILVMLAASTLTGLFWGLIRQLLSIAGLVAGIYLAGRFYEPVATFLHPSEGGGLVADANWAKIIAFGAIVIGVSLLAGVVGSALRLVANLLLLGWLDHLLGGLLGFVNSLLLVSALLAVATIFPVPNLSDAVKDSQVAHMVGGFTPVVLNLLPPEFLIFRQLMGA
jgi:membrane protein required for colicin V production